MSKVYRVRVREVSEAIHQVVLEDGQEVPEGDDWADLIGQQDSEPVEVVDVQIDEVLSYEPVDKVGPVN